jgi:hypothetical protein
MDRKGPTEEDRDEALQRLLSGLAAGNDVFELAASVADLHPKYNTFPGEVFMELAADVIEIADATRNNPIPMKACERPTYLNANSVAGTIAESSMRSSPVHRCGEGWNLNCSMRWDGGAPTTTGVTHSTPPSR